MKHDADRKTRNILDFTINVIETIPRIFGYFCGILVMLSILLTLVEVTVRYVSGHSLLIADEFGGYLCVAMGFFGAAVTWQEKGHVRVSMVISRIPQKAVNWLRIVTIFSGLLFSGIFTYGTFLFLKQSFFFNARSGTWINTPLAYMQLPMIIGFSLMTIIILLDLISAIRKIREKQNIEIIE